MIDSSVKKRSLPIVAVLASAIALSLALAFVPSQGPDAPSGAAPPEPQAVVQDPAPQQVDAESSATREAIPPPRFIGWINCYGAQFQHGSDCETWPDCEPDSGPVNGVGGQWRGPNAVKWLIGELERKRDLGITTVVLSRPAGVAPFHDNPNNRFSWGASWETIPQYKRDLLQEQLKPWLAENPEMRLYVYFTARWWELDSLASPPPDVLAREELHGFDPAIEKEREAWHAVTDPWREIGIAGIGIDSGSRPMNAEWIRRLIAYERGRDDGLDLWIEAIPANVGNPDRDLHRRAAPAMALIDYVMHEPRGLIDYQPREGENLILWLAQPGRAWSRKQYVDFALHYLDLGWSIMARDREGLADIMHLWEGEE